MRVGTRRKLLSRVISIVAVATLALSGSLLAQGVTTSAMTGVVTDSAKNPLAGAHVSAVHVPSGTAYSATTRSDGRFTIPGMRVGGPYRVTVSQIGYRRQVQNEINLQLGVAADLAFVMGSVSVELEPIVVSAKADAVFSSQRTGAATAIATQQIASLPTVNRFVDDILRLTPEYSSNGFGYSFAGQLDYFNNMTIDGAYFNNSFGLAGEPGGRTGVAAVSLDAVEQIEVNVAPYDVRQGNFVGAGVNMVTKSGTNDYTGSLYYGFRSSRYVGSQAGPNTFTTGTFDYHNVGLNIGGPILKNKLFFFTSWEQDLQTSPGTTYTANTGGQPVTGNTTRVLASDLNALSSYLQTNFNYATGPYQGYSFNVPSNRFLARLDYNLNDNNKLSLRYNVLNSSSDILISNSSSLGLGCRRYGPSPCTGTSALNFATSNYGILENIRSTVAEWNSTIGSRMSNNLTVGYTSNNENRRSVAPPWFPEVEILQGGTNYTTFGFEPFTPDNQLIYHSFQMQDNFNVYLPKHTLTFGISVEQYHSKNVFFPGAQSVYVYDSLAQFYRDANAYLAQCGPYTVGQPLCSRTGPSPVNLRLFQYRYGNIPGQTEPVQPLDVLYAGAYVQDQWRPTPELTVTAGLRVDAPQFGHTAYDNAVADTMHFRGAGGDTVHYNSGALPPVNPLLSPRLGFNYDLNGKHQTQIRGGTGVFSGRPAYVWISNQVGNTGVLTGFISQSNTSGPNTAYPFNPNPNAYAPATVTGGPAQTFELNFTDKNFKFPQVWRSNIAVDQRLPLGLTGTVDLLYTKDLNGIGYVNVNLPAADSFFSGPDNRPRWYLRSGCVPPPGVTTCQGYRIYQNVSDAPVLTNEGIGHAYNISFSLERPLIKGFYGKVGYTYGESKNTGDPGSIAYGNWTGITSHGDPNNPGLGYSASSPGNRIFAALTYTGNLIMPGPTSIGLYLDGHNFGNGSYVFSGDMNGDGVNGNDLIYIPKDTSQMNFIPLTVGTTTYTRVQQQTAWTAFINQDKYLSSHRGQYAQRNAVFLPIIWRLDGSLTQDIGQLTRGRANSLQLRVDVLNLTNLLNSNWGTGYTLTTTQPLVYKGVDPLTNMPTYTLQTVGGKLISSSFTKTAGTTDVWRINLSLRYNF